MTSCGEGCLAIVGFDPVSDTVVIQKADGHPFAVQGNAITLTATEDGACAKLSSGSDTFVITFTDVIGAAEALDENLDNWLARSTAAA